MFKLFGENVVFDNEEAQETRYSQIFTRRHLTSILFVAIIWTCQVIPMFGIYTFGPQIISLLGLNEGKEAVLGNVVISLFFLIGCIPAMYWLNSIGRRPLLIGSFAIMTLALAVLGVVPDPSITLIVSAFALYAFSPAGRGFYNGFILTNCFLRISAHQPLAPRCHSAGLVP